MQTDIRQTGLTDMSGSVKDYSIAPMSTDGVSEQPETYWDNSKFNQWFAYYKTIPEYKAALDAFATWCVGRGWEAESLDVKVILENMTGWGEDTFQSILWNLIVTKKLCGDAFAEVIRGDSGKLINLKPLDPASIRIVANRKGTILRYEQRTKTSTGTSVKKFQPVEILHLCNNRIADEIHGTSITEALQDVIDTIQEAMTDYRRILHRSTIRVLRVDEDDKTRLTNLKADYAEAIKKGELLIIPGKRGDSEFEDLAAPNADTFLAWLNYQTNRFYMALGIPKVVLGGTAENTEASAKVSVIVFDPIFWREIMELEADLWNQLGIRITINKQPSLMDNAQSDESKNTGQTGFQPNDVEAGVGK